MSITLEDVTVRRGRRDVLNGLHWQIPQSGRTLLLGRNGAGKTTTLRVVCGAQAVRSGSVLVGERSASSADLRRMSALMPQTITSVPGLTVLEQVAFSGWLSGLSEKESRSRAREALGQVDLLDHQDHSPSKLSGGELRRVGLAEAIVRPAQVLMLDEPTAGLDPTQRARFRDILTGVQGPIVVSTHQLDDVDELYDTVAVLESGRLVFTGTMAEFLARGAGSSAARQAESAFVELTKSVAAQ